jgi:phospholipase C
MSKSQFTLHQIGIKSLFIALSIFGLSSSALAATTDDLAPLDPPEDGGKTKRMTILSYNIQQLGYPNWAGDHFEKERLEMIPQALLSLDKQPEVLIFQEVFTLKAFDFLVKKLSAHYPFHTLVAGENCQDPTWASVSGNCQEDTVKSNSGVLIFSIWPIAEQHAYVYRAVRISKTFDFMAQKGVVYAKIQIGTGQPSYLHVFGTHLQATAKDHDIRMLQISEMRKFIDSFAIPASDPVILGGDFNVSSTQQARLDDLLSGANVALTLETEGVGSSSDATNGYRQLLSGPNAKQRPDKTLDYVFYRTDHLHPVNQPKLQVINLKSRSPWTGTRLLNPDVELFDLSDHYPVALEFVFPDQSR